MTADNLRSNHVSMLQVTGVSMQSVLIDTDLNGCAFVCGSFSFLDKISCGLALFVLQSYQSKLQFSGPFPILNSSVLIYFCRILKGSIGLGFSVTI